MGVTDMNTGPGDTWACDPWFYCTQTALALVKQHYKEGQRLKSESLKLLARLKQHKKREAELRQEKKERRRAQGPDCVRLTLYPQAQAGLEYKLLQVERLIKGEMERLEEQNERLETHMREQRALYEHILDGTSVIEMEEGRKSVLQHEAVQHEMESLTHEMGRLNKLLEDFDGISRASGAALLSRHASLEKNRVHVSGNGSEDTGSALNPSDSEILWKQSGARRSGFFQRTPRKVTQPVEDATPTEEDNPPMASRKRQRGMILAEMERIQSEAKKLEIEAEEREVLLEVVSSLSQQSKEGLAAHQRVDAESMWNSPSDDMSGDSNVSNDASTIHTPSEAGLVPSASPSPDVEQGGEESPEAEKLADDLGLSDHASATPSEVLTTDSLYRDDIQSVVKRIDFEDIGAIEGYDTHSNSSSVTCITENEIAAACGGNCVESDGAQSRHSTTSEHVDEAASIDEEFVCESVESSSDEEDEEDSETFSGSTSGTEDEEDSNSLEGSVSEAEKPSAERTAERATSPSLSDVCSGNEQDVAEIQDDGSKSMGDAYYEGTSGSKKENGSCSVHLEKSVKASLSETHHLQLPLLRGMQTEDQVEITKKPQTEELAQQVALYADQVKEMRQTVDWFQENLQQEENNRQAAEQQSERLSDLCADQAMKVKELSNQRDEFERKWMELKGSVDSRLQVQHEEDLAVEVTIAASGGCPQDNCIPEWKLREEARNNLLDEQKRLLDDQLKEGEKLRCSLETKVVALRRQVEHLELSRQISEEMAQMMCYQNRAWRQAWRFIIQAFLFFLGVYVWLKNFRSEVAIPLPT